MGLKITLTAQNVFATNRLQKHHSIRSARKVNAQLVPSVISLKQIVMGTITSLMSAKQMVRPTPIQSARSASVIQEVSLLRVVDLRRCNARVVLEKNSVALTNTWILLSSVTGRHEKTQPLMGARSALKW
jgi:hypothetical protein